MRAPQSGRFIAIASKSPEQSPPCAGQHDSSAEANTGKRDPSCDALSPFEYTVGNAFIRSSQAVSSTFDYPHVFVHLEGQLRPRLRRSLAPREN